MSRRNETLAFLGLGILATAAYVVVQSLHSVERLRRATLVEGDGVPQTDARASNPGKLPVRSEAVIHNDGAVEVPSGSTESGSGSSHGEQDVTRHVLELLLEDPSPDLLYGVLPPGEVSLLELLQFAGYDPADRNVRDRLKSVAEDVKRSSAKIAGHLQAAAFHLILTNLDKLDRGEFTAYPPGEVTLGAAAPGTIQCLHPDARGKGHRVFIVSIAQHPDLKAHCDAAELEHRRRTAILYSALGPPR